ncbi:sensor histidine kinase [Flagellimonas sp.]|jgi:sensor histidine kinase YesM|uniref:sensor histidine kinase n=1 Tax=Flagellimonas sp. TaxID=2058762 RepID=UPI003BA91CC2
MYDVSLHDGLQNILSILITAGCFNLALYFGYNRKLSYLFFALYCFLHCFKVYLKTFPPEANIIGILPFNTLDYIYMTVILGMFFLISFLSYHFAVQKKKEVLFIFIVFSIVSFFLISELVYIWLSILGCLIIILHNRKIDRKALFFLFGLSGLALCTYLGVEEILDYGYFAGMIFFIFWMVLASAFELSEQNKKYELTLLRSSRLENQLLKKNIQPHFILNSLTNLQELIEVNPNRASEFVQHLSNEFRLFAKISDRKLITLKDEIQLVKSFLAIMSIRKNLNYTLKLENLDLDDLIPPGVILTVMENGITHGYNNGGEAYFKITGTKGNGYVQYTVYNDGTAPSELDMKEEGMGLQYVRSRMQESYSNKFFFRSMPLPEGWQTTLKIYE